MSNNVFYLNDYLDDLEENIQPIIDMLVNHEIFNPTPEIIAKAIKNCEDEWLCFIAQPIIKRDSIKSTRHNALVSEEFIVAIRYQLREILREKAVEMYLNKEVFDT